MCRIPFKAVALQLFKGKTMPDIRSLEFDCDGLSDTDLEPLFNFISKAGQKSLFKLKLINFHSFKHLTKFKSLDIPTKIGHLELEKCTIHPRVFLSSIFPNLISLELKKVNADLQSLRGLSKLKILEVSSQPQSFFNIKDNKPVVLDGVKEFRILLDKPISFASDLKFYLMNVEINTFDSIKDFAADDKTKHLVALASTQKTKMKKLILNIPDKFTVDELAEIVKDKNDLKEIRVRENSISSEDVKKFEDQFSKIEITSI